MTPPRRHGWLTDPRMQLGALTFGHFSVDFLGGFLSPLQSPTLLKHLGCEIWMLTVLVAISGFWINLLQPLAGVFLRKHGSGWILVAAPLVAMATAFMGLTTSYGGIVTLVLVSGIGIAVYHPDGMMAAHAVRGVRDSLAMPIFASGGFLGYSAGIKTAAWWGTHFDLDGFWLLAMVGIGSSLLLYACGLHRLKGHADEPPRESGQPGHAFWTVVLLCTSLVTSYTFFSTFLPRLMVILYGAEAQNTAGTALLLYGLFGALASYGWGWLSDRTGRAMAIFLSQAGGLFAYRMLLQELTPEGSTSAILAWSFLTGVLLSGAFPIALTMARNARGLTPRLRAGLSMGGSWGLAALLLLASPLWTNDESALLGAAMWSIVVSMALAFVMTLAKTPAKRDNSGAQKTFVPR